MFWVSYECFSISYDAFLLKSVISSHNSCDLLEYDQEYETPSLTLKKKLKKFVLLITICIFIFVYPKFHRNCILKYLIGHFRKKIQTLFYNKVKMKIHS